MRRSPCSSGSWTHQACQSGQVPLPSTKTLVLERARTPVTVAPGVTIPFPVPGLDQVPPEDRPPVLIPFLTFRIMVGCGLVMLAIAWLGSYLSLKQRLEQNRFLLWLTFLSFPLPFVAILTGWYTAEVGRQPWVVYGVLRTADAMTPFLTARAASISRSRICDSASSKSSRPIPRSRRKSPAF